MALRAWVFFCVLGLVLAGCAGGEDGTVADSVTTTTRPPAFEAPEGQASGTISITASPPPGTYEYTQTGTTHVLDQGTDPKPMPPKGTLEVDPASQGPSGFEQMQTRFDGTGDRIEQNILYASDGVYLAGYETDVSVVGSKRSFVCKPDRPVRIFPQGVAVGDRWEDRVDCENGQIHYLAVAEALEDVTLGDGTVVPTLKVRVENTIDGEGLRTDSTYVLWVSPDLGISVKTEDSTDAELSVYDIERRTQDLLVSTTPG
ncbi:MAG: hypothetical protein IT198_11790 [Acidimicrobiia bacterium]|nr:hypothetical protein [Acidimicrobiia bacterium]